MMPSEMKHNFPNLWLDDIDEGGKNDEFFNSRSFSLRKVCVAACGFSLKLRANGALN